MACILSFCMCSFCNKLDKNGQGRVWSHLFSPERQTWLKFEPLTLIIKKRKLSSLYAVTSGGNILDALGINTHFLNIQLGNIVTRIVMSLKQQQWIF